MHALPASLFSNCWYLWTAMATVEHIRSLGHRVGIVDVTSFRPFPGAELVEALKNLKAFSVIERLDVPLAIDNPLTAEIESAFAKAIMGIEGYPKIDRILDKIRTKGMKSLSLRERWSLRRATRRRRENS